MKVSPEFLPDDQGPNYLPIPREAITDLMTLKADYFAALSTGDTAKVEKAKEKIHDFLVETELLTEDHLEMLDPDSQKAVMEAKKLTEDLYDKKNVN